MRQPLWSLPFLPSDGGSVGHVQETGYETRLTSQLAKEKGSERTTKYELRVVQREAPVSDVTP